jgi:hypothetical protein
LNKYGIEIQQLSTGDIESGSLIGAYTPMSVQLSKGQLEGVLEGARAALLTM